jgi:hypothetical protein
MLKSVGVPENRCAFKLAPVRKHESHDDVLLSGGVAPPPPMCKSNESLPH